MRRESLSSLLVGASLALTLTGCSGVEVPQESPPPKESQKIEDSPSPAPEPVSEPWVGPSDGTWDYGDAELGQPVKTRLSDYAITVTSTPVFGPLDDGGRVEVSASLRVKRVEDRGDRYGTKITESEKVAFTPGNLSYPRHNEAYGLKTEFVCEPGEISVGEKAKCTVSFTAPADEMPDFHWWINGEAAAAWPGQKVTD